MDIQAAALFRSGMQQHVRERLQMVHTEVKEGDED